MDDDKDTVSNFLTTSIVSMVAFLVCMVAVSLIFNSEDEQQPSTGTKPALEEPPPPTQSDGSLISGGSGDDQFEQMLSQADSINYDLALFSDAEAAYLSVNNSYTADCDELQSYNREFAERYAANGMGFICQRLQADPNGASYSLEFALVDSQGGRPQMFQQSADLDGKIYRTCQAAIQIGCVSGQWKKLGANEDR